MSAPVPASRPLVPARARTARGVVAVAFGAQGLAYAVLLQSLPGFKDRFSIDDDVVTLVVLGVCLMAALGSVVADRVARGRGGSRVVLTTGLTAVVAAVLLIAAAPGRTWFFLGFALYGLGLGLVDAGTNMQAVGVQRVYGRSILSGFYGAWSAAAVLGALFVSWYVHVGLPQQAALPMLAAPVAVVAVLVLRQGWRGHDAPVETADHAEPADRLASAVPAGMLPWSGILVLGLAVVAYYVVDTALSTWSSIYLTEVVAASAALAPLGYGGYVATTLVSRLCGDLVVRRWGRVRVVRGAGILGSIGLLAVVLAPSPAVAIGGFMLTGLGLGVVAPLSFAAAGDLAPEHADAVVARLNGFNYVERSSGASSSGRSGSVRRSASASRSRSSSRCSWWRSPRGSAAGRRVPARRRTAAPPVAA